MGLTRKPTTPKQPFSQTVIGYVVLGLLVAIIGGLVLKWITDGLLVSSPRRNLSLPDPANRRGVSIPHPQTVTNRPDRRQQSQPLPSGGQHPTESDAKAHKPNAPPVVSQQIHHGYTITLRRVNAGLGHYPWSMPRANLTIVNHNSTDHYLAFDCSDAFLVDERGNTHKAEDCYLAGSTADISTDGSSGQRLVPGITYAAEVLFDGIYDALNDQTVVPILRFECVDTTDSTRFLLQFRDVPIQPDSQE